MLSAPPKASSTRCPTGETPGAAEVRPVFREGAAALGDTVRCPSREGGRGAAGLGWGWMGWKALAISRSSIEEEAALEERTRAPRRRGEATRECVTPLLSPPASGLLGTGATGCAPSPLCGRLGESTTNAGAAGEGILSAGDCCCGRSLASFLNWGFFAPAWAGCAALETAAVGCCAFFARRFLLFEFGWGAVSAAAAAAVRGLRG